MSTPPPRSSARASRWTRERRGPPADPQTLYRHWEQEQWNPWAVELAADEAQWQLHELLPAVANALAPPDQEDSDWEALGATSSEIRQFALDGLTRRLNIIGVPPTEQEHRPR